MKIKNNNKGFTLVEILVVIAILAILSTIAISAISNYIQKGKDKYDSALEKQLLLAGKEYYAEGKDKRPKYKNESSFVTLAELRTLNIVKKDFIDSMNNKCSNKSSSVMITNEGKGKYSYTACLFCGENSRFNNVDSCTMNRYVESTPEESQKKCVADDDWLYDGDGKKLDNKLDNLGAYYDSCGEPPKCNVIQLGSKKYYYGNGNYYESEQAAQNDGQCGIENCVITNYYNKSPNYSPKSENCVINTTQTYDNIGDLNKVLGESKKSPEKYLANTAYYSHCLTKNTYNELKEKTSNISNNNYSVTNGTTASSSEYLNAHKETIKLLTSTNSFVEKNKQIPNEYTFQIGKPSENAIINNPTPMSWANVKKWGTSYSNYAPKDGVSLNDIDAKEKYYAKYTKVGSYNGKDVDLKMTLMDFEGCKLNSGASKCGLWFQEKQVGIYSLGINWIKVKYEFYETGTSKKVDVKGYTTYWDIDAHQGIHFLTNTTGIYVYNENKSYVSTVNGSPYVYDRVRDLYSNYASGGVVTETFKGSSMTKVFTFLTAKNSNFYKIYSSAGEIYHDTIPRGISLSYQGKSESSVFKDQESVGYIVRFANTTSKTQTIKVTLEAENMVYENGSSKYGDTKISDPIKNGNMYTWTIKNVAGLNAGSITFKMNAKGCGEMAKVSAETTIGGTDYMSQNLTNPILCSIQQKITNNCSQ